MPPPRDLCQPQIMHITSEAHGGRWQPIWWQVSRLVDEAEWRHSHGPSGSRRRHALGELELLYVRLVPPAEDSELMAGPWEALEEIGRTVRDQLWKGLEIVGRALLAATPCLPLFEVWPGDYMDQLPYPALEQDPYFADQGSLSASSSSASSWTSSESDEPDGDYHLV